MKLLIVSSYRRRCGIAQYVEHLEPALRAIPNLELSFAPLPSILRADGEIAKRSAKTIIEDIVRMASEADVVNLQYEPGLYGRHQHQVWSRIRRIIAASKRVIVTYHTIAPTAHFSIRRPVEYVRALYGGMSFRGIMKLSRRTPGKFSHIVHTKRERYAMELQGIPAETIADVPLAFLSKRQKEEYDFPRYHKQLQDRFGLHDKHLIGCFGFLAPYKGTHVAIRALENLPDNYHLLLVGQLHPQAIVQGKASQPYITKLLRLLEKRPSLRSRVHFCGAPDDKQFIEFMAGCDSVVLPYAEVGQTSSGPASFALDLNRPTYAAANHCFRELDRYSPGMLSFFDIGNHVELAQLLTRRDGDGTSRTLTRDIFRQKYSVEARANVYAECCADLLGRPRKLVDADTRVAA